MTDEELVKRLRDEHLAMTRNEAAARIEALTAERDEALNQLDSARHSVDVLEKRVAFVEGERRKTFQALLKVTKIHDEVEAKLAKAVEALTFYTCAENGCGNCPEQDRGRVSCGWTARATLAEIEGKKG
jgi:hypothetical protein